MPRYARFERLTHSEIAAISKEKLPDLILFYTDITITLAHMCMQYVLVLSFLQWGSKLSLLN